MYSSIPLWGINIPTFGLLISTGVLFFVILLIQLLRKNHVSEKMIDNVIIIGGISGVVFALGAKVFDTLWHSISHMKEFNTSFEMLWEEGGITFSGGLFCGILCFFILFPLLVKTNRSKVFFIFDLMTPGIAIAHGFGRFGCFFGGCCYGKVVPLHTPFSMVYETEVGLQNVYPTQLFEAFFLLALAAVLFFFIKKNRTAWYLLGYNVFRFVLEYFRGDDRGLSPFGFLSPSQFMSIIMIVIGLIILIFRKNIESWLQSLEKKKDDETNENLYDNEPKLLFENKFINLINKYRFFTYYLLSFVFVFTFVFFGIFSNGVNFSKVVKKTNFESIEITWNDGDNNHSSTIEKLESDYLIKTTDNLNEYTYIPSQGKLLVSLNDGSKTIDLEYNADVLYRYRIYSFSDKPKVRKEINLFNDEGNKISEFFNEADKASFEQVKTNKVINNIRFFLNETKDEISNSYEAKPPVLIYIILIIELLLIVVYTLFICFGSKIFKNTPNPAWSKQNENSEENN